MWPTAETDQQETSAVQCGLPSMLRRLGQGQRCRCAARAFGLASVVLIGLAPSQIQRVHPPRPAIRLGQAAATGTRAAEREIRRLIARLDAPRFESRNEAARQLSAKGHAALPYLAEALGQPSSEVRFRARVLLIRHPSFEEVAPHLVIALEKRHGLRARAILHERVLQQLDVIGQSRSADQLFKFWNLDAASFCSRTAASFDDARTGAEIARAVQPLLGLSDRAVRFNDAMERLESLALPCAHQYSPGFVIAETLARGLHENHAARAAFAEQHLEAFETLAANLHLRGLPPHAVRKELLDRANFSQGAAGYLAQTLDETAWRRAMLSQRIGVSPESLQQEFLRGVASPDLAQYNLGVGKVHIYDMLSEALHAWPDGPHDGVVQRLVGETAKAAATGDKPKALAFLDALDACRDLSQHGLRVQDGLGERLAERLFDAAKEAENNRVYHPARIVHNRIVALVDMGVSVEHKAFPREWFEAHLQGAAAATSDEQRLALERYVRILEGLRGAGLSLDQAGVERFALAMRDHVAGRQETLAAGAKEMARLLAERGPEDGKSDPPTVARALAQWTDRWLAQASPGATSGDSGEATPKGTGAHNGEDASGGRLRRQ